MLMMTGLHPGEVAMVTKGAEGFNICLCLLKCAEIRMSVQETTQLFRNHKLILGQLPQFLRHFASLDVGGCIKVLAPKTEGQSCCPQSKNRHCM